jgi:hypothetical protein
VGQVDYHAFFDFIMEKIRADRDRIFAANELGEPQPIQFLKAEWYSVQDKIIDYYPFNTMKKIHLDKHVQDKNSRRWKDLMKYSTEHPKFGKRYKEIFDCEKRIDELVAEKAIHSIQTTKAILTKLVSNYKGNGALYEDKQLDLITMKFSGFLKLKYETRSWEEKGLDTAIACQMIASCLNNACHQVFDDEHDLVPNYHTDIVVLISSDMDFMEAFKILHTLKVPCYMVHITNRLPKDLNGNHPYCEHMNVSEKEMENLLI